jgi:hypothetical protein
LRIDWSANSAKIELLEAIMRLFACPRNLALQQNGSLSASAKKEP